MIRITKVAHGQTKGKAPALDEFDHYVAVDWAERVMALAHMGRRADSLQSFERPARLQDLREYLESLGGTVVLTFEEMTTAQWLYLELVDSVTRLIVCDPFHNRLLCHGAKTDRIDAAKLCQLLRAGLLKEVFHRRGTLYELRRLVSSYEDVVRTGVRCRNQQHALTRSHAPEQGPGARLAADYLTASIALYEQTKRQYEERFALLCRRLTSLKHLCTIPGIGQIGAVKILAYVVDIRRFPSTAQYLSYCGLVKHPKWSGGKSYGRRTGRYNHALKAVFKTGALAVLRMPQGGPFQSYLEHWRAKGLAEYNVRHSLARLLSRTSFGVLKHGQAFHLHHHDKENSTTANS